MVPSTEGSDLTTVLGKAVAVLRAFTAEDHELSLAAIVQRTGLNKTSAHRIAQDLTRHRLLDRTDHGYRLSGGLFELGMRASVERSLLELAMPVLQELYERTHETVHLGVLEGNEVVYIAKIAGRGHAASPSRTGGRMPTHCTAIGKILLAWADDDVRRQALSAPMERRTPHTVTAPGRLAAQLDAARAEGVAWEREESALGLQCVAAPVVDAEGRAIAALSVTGPVGRFKPERHVDLIRSAGQSLSALLARRRSLVPRSSAPSRRS